MNDDQIFVGLDIGTTKIAAVVARLDDYNTLNIGGVGTAPSHGLRRGVVINIEKTVNSIKKAIEQAQLMSGCHIENIYAGMSQQSNNLAGIDDPAGMIIFGDAHCAIGMYKLDPPTGTSYWWVTDYQNAYWRYRHNEMANFGFADGHAKALRDPPRGLFTSVSGD